MANNIYLTPTATMYQATSAASLNDQQHGVGATAISAGALVKVPSGAGAALPEATVKANTAEYNKSQNGNH